MAKAHVLTLEQMRAMASPVRQRIIAALNDGRLLSLDARTGQPDPNFGNGGVVDLRAGVEQLVRNDNRAGRHGAALQPLPDVGARRR